MCNFWVMWKGLDDSFQKIYDIGWSITIIVLNGVIQIFSVFFGRVEWAGAELNGLDTWECHI